MVNQRGPQSEPKRRRKSTSENLKEDVRHCGRWVLRQTKIRQARGKPNSGTIEEVTRKRKHRSSTIPSEPPSEESWVGENCVLVITTMNDLADIGMWGSNTTGVFITIMLDEVKKEGLSRSKMDRNFTHKQWLSIEREMQKRLKRNGYTVKKLQGKFTRLKRQYRAFRDLKDNQIGLGWDPETQTVTMADDQWKLYIQAHPDAKQFQTKGLDHYELLAELLGNSMATGAFGRGNRQGEPTSDDEREMEELMARIRAGIGLASETTSGSNGKRKSDGTEWVSKPQKRHGKGKGKESAWENISLCQKAKADWYESRNAKNTVGSSSNTTQEAIQLLNGMKNDVGHDQLLKAFDKFVNNKELREAWIHLDPEIRLMWVNNME